MKDYFAPLFCGTLFGVGLAMSGMTDASRVIGFLDIFGKWDPTLAFVLGGGLLITLPFFQFGLGRLQVPLFTVEFKLPVQTDLDIKLISGAILFGVGWGMVGLCPGPAIAAIAYLNPDLFYFLVAMFAGMFLADIAESRIRSVLG